MKRLSENEIAEILSEHEKWLANPNTGRQAHFKDCEFVGFCFPQYCTLTDCTLTDCTLTGCTVTDCTVSYGKVSGCTLTDCTLTGCTVTDCTVSYGKVSGCTVTDCTVSICTVTDCTVSICTVSYCTVTDGKVSGCTVTGGKVSGCTVTGKKLKILEGYSGLYPYNVWAVLFEDGSRWVRMGCLFKSLEEWDKITIRASNVREFPDDGSDKCEERVAAFEFAKSAALRLK